MGNIFFKMKKLSLKKINKLDEHPQLKNLPEELKDPARFEEIERELMKIMLSDHSHAGARKPLQSFLNCKRCHDKMIKKRRRIDELGFESYEQYLLWKKVNSIIINEVYVGENNKEE